MDFCLRGTGQLTIFSYSRGSIFRCGCRRPSMQSSRDITLLYSARFLRSLRCLILRLLAQRGGAGVQEVNTARVFGSSGNINFSSLLSSLSFFLCSSLHVGCNKLILRSLCKLLCRKLLLI